MKQLLSLILAGIVGGIITLSGFQLFINQNSTPEQTEQFAKQVKNVNIPPQVDNITFDFKEAAAKAMPTVVHISAKQSTQALQQQRENQDDPLSRFFGNDFFFGNPLFEQMPKQGTGSGVIYTSDGYIITNNHVVGFADEVEITTYDNQTFSAVKVGTYPQSDLAVLKIDAQNLPTLELADSDYAEIGEWVLAVGNPLELNSTVTAGIISAKGRDIDIIQDNRAIESFIQTDAAVNPGNSGGALVDAQGRLLGINTAIATRTGYYQGYSFAIPINIVKNVADEIIEHGSYERGFLGIEIADLEQDDVNELGIDITQGVLVAKVVDGGAAQYAGLLPNDVIVEANGKNIKTSAELIESLGSAKVGDKVELKVNRYGEIIDLPIRLKAGS